MTKSATISLLILFTLSIFKTNASPSSELDKSSAEYIPIIDAHSQIPFGAGELNKIINLMDKGGIACAILASKGPLKARELTSFALQNEGRVLPAVRTKCRAYREDNNNGFKNYLRQQTKLTQFGAMAEILLYHAEKGLHRTRAPEVVIYPDDRRVLSALKVAKQNGWPFIVHIEFNRAGPKADQFMAKFESLLKKHPSHPFILIHMGQLNHSAIRHLIKSHPNIYFITSHSTNIEASPIAKVSKVDDPRTKMFEEDHLAPEWKKLLEEYPERFILGFDNVWPEHWSSYYLEQIKIWRRAFSELSPETAHALAHGNAERLWNLGKTTYDSCALIK